MRDFDEVSLYAQQTGASLAYFYLTIFHIDLLTVQQSSQLSHTNEASNRLLCFADVRLAIWLLSRQSSRIPTMTKGERATAGRVPCAVKRGVSRERRKSPTGWPRINTYEPVDETTLFSVGRFLQTHDETGVRLLSTGLSYRDGLRLRCVRVCVCKKIRTQIFNSNQLFCTFDE